MAAFAVKGPQQVTSVKALLSGQNYGSNNNFSSNSCFCNFPAWSRNNDRRHAKLFAQGPKRNYPYDDQPFESDIDFSNPFAPGIQIDLFNRITIRPPLSEKTKAVVADQRKRRQKALQQRTIDFVDGLVQKISSHKKNYKYFLTASKKNANLIMEQGFISSSALDEILCGLQMIEKDIEEGKFKWINNVDVRTNIIKALIEIIGAPAKRLDAIMSHYVQQLTVLQIWCCDSIDKIVTQIKELQLELVLLAMRNEGLVLPYTRSRAKWILLSDLVLSKLEQLERNVCRLLNCKDEMNVKGLTALPSGNIDDPKNSLSKDSSVQMHNSIINFGNMIVGDIAHDLSNLERDLASWVQMDVLMPNDVVTRNRLLMNKYMLDMDKFTAVRSSYSIYVPVEDSRERFSEVYKIIPELLKAQSEFVKSSSFNHENIQNFPPGIFAPGLAGPCAIKVEAKQNQIDCARSTLLDWLQHLQLVRKN